MAGEPMVVGMAGEESCAGCKVSPLLLSPDGTNEGLFCGDLMLAPPAAAKSPGGVDQISHNMHFTRGFEG